MKVWWRDGREVEGKSRYWKGNDARYLILTVDGQHLPEDLSPGHRVRAEARDRLDIFVVRSIEHDMREDVFTVSCVDEQRWHGITRLRPLPRPPKFRTQEEADAWLEAHG